MAVIHGEQTVLLQYEGYLKMENSKTQHRSLMRLNVLQVMNTVLVGDDVGYGEDESKPDEVENCEVRYNVEGCFFASKWHQGQKDRFNIL